MRALSPPSFADDLAEPDSGTERTATPRLFTIRLVALHDTLKRSATMAYRREFGLTGLEWKIVGKVGEYGSLSLSELAEILVADTGQLSRAVKTMVERGMLESRRRSGGPGIVISLSSQGIAVHRRMVEVAVARNEFLTGGLPPEQIEQTMRVMEELRARAQLLLERERALNVRPAPRKTRSRKPADD